MLALARLGKAKRESATAVKNIFRKQFPGDSGYKSNWAWDESARQWTPYRSTELDHQNARYWMGETHEAVKYTFNEKMKVPGKLITYFKNEKIKQPAVEAMY